MQYYKTAKGTELPLMDIRGKPYMQVAHRLVWFSEEKPEWRIETEIIQHSQDYSVVKATIRDEKGNIMAQAHKSENSEGFRDHLEKCESSAIGRALAMRGYGTQFAMADLDEGDRLADSPMPPAKPVAPPPFDANEPFPTTPYDYGIKEPDVTEKEAFKSDLKAKEKKYANHAPAKAGGISEAQGKRLFAIAKSKIISTDDIMNEVRSRVTYEIERLSDIKRADYDSICQYFESLPNLK